MLYDYFETTTILMDTSSCNFLWSYCESLFYYGFDLCHTYYPSQLPFRIFHCKALIMLEILCLSKSCITIWRRSEKHPPSYSFPYSGLTTIMDTSQVFANLYHLFLKESMELNNVKDKVCISPAFICWNSTPQKS